VGRQGFQHCAKKAMEWFCCVMAMEKEGGQDMTGLQAHPNVAKNAEHYRPCDSLKRES